MTKPQPTTTIGVRGDYETPQATRTINKTNDAPTVVINASKDIKETTDVKYSYTVKGITKECNKSEYEASIKLDYFEGRCIVRN